MKLLFTNLFLKISRIIVIDLHFFCSVNRSRNWIHVHQAWRAIFYCIHPGYWWPVLEFEFRIGAVSVNNWFWINLYKSFVIIKITKWTRWRLLLGVNTVKVKYSDSQILQIKIWYQHKSLHTPLNSIKHH